MMLDKPGIYEINSVELESIADKYNQSGWLVIELSTGIASKDNFFDAIRNACPLDPPLHSNRSWDALADSLWSGLHGLACAEIVILWPDAGCMKIATPEEFYIATDILGDLCVSLSDSNITASRPKKLLVFQCTTRSIP
jgi:hypothetical protein